MEAARALAERALKEAGANPAAYLFRLATSRAPTKGEERALVDLAARSTARYRQNPTAARKLLHVGESEFDAKLDLAGLAGWTTVASVALNLDETITKQ